MNTHDKTELYLHLFHTGYEGLHRYAYTLLKDSVSGFVMGLASAIHSAKAGNQCQDADQ